MASRRLISTSPSSFSAAGSLKPPACTAARICSSVKAVTRSAAQKVSSARGAQQRRRRHARHSRPRDRTRRPRSGRSRGSSWYGTVCHGLSVEAERDQSRFQHRPDSRTGTRSPRPSRAGRWRRCRTSSRRPAGSAGRHRGRPPSTTRVERVAGLHVDEVRPRAEHLAAPAARGGARAARCRSGSSRTRAVVLECAERPCPAARGRPPRGTSRRRRARPAREHVLEIVAASSGGACPSAARCVASSVDVDLVRIDSSDDSSRPGCSRAPRRAASRPRPRRSRAAGCPRRIEADEPDDAVAVARGEAGRRAGGLRARHRPPAGRRAADR